MKLLLDIGNSSVNWVMEEQEQFISKGVFSYDKNNFVNSLQENLLLSQKPSNILVSNVAGPEVLLSLNNWVKKQWQQTLWQPPVAAKFKELKNSYSDTQQMGIDRWLAMVASREKYQSALCVVDCGTALTIDAIDSEGNHLGGYIIPGIELMQRSLIINTERINISVQNQVLLDYANNTQAAVYNGTVLATVTMIDRVVNNLSKESNCNPKCIISGGMAESIKPLLEHPFEHEPNLVLDGLLIVHKATQ
ncbi:MAG: type III pantothenate kinase [Proteobacteria bacterium]|nr:type III pantothenate kinase [Pseudomonadota bacterium]